MGLPCRPLPFACVLIGMITTFFSSNYTILTLEWYIVCAFFVDVVNEDLCKIHPCAWVNDITTTTLTHCESAASIYITAFFSHPLLSFLQFKRFNREYLHIFYEVSIQKWHDTLHSILTALWADLRAFFRSSANISYVNNTLQHACSAFKHNYTRRIEQFQLPRWKGKVPRKGHEPQKPMP